MPAKRELTMRQLRQMLRLHHDGLGAREIGRRLGVARSTIQDNLKRAQVAELFWPLPPDLSGSWPLILDGTTARSAEFATFRLAACAYFWSSRCGAFGAASAVR